MVLNYATANLIKKVYHLLASFPGHGDKANHLYKIRGYFYQIWLPELQIFTASSHFTDAPSVNTLPIPAQTTEQFIHIRNVIIIIPVAVLVIGYSPNMNIL